MKRSIRIKLMAGAVEVFLAGAAIAQGPVFRQHELTEEKLIETLAPRDAGIRTRSLRVGPATPTGQSASASPIDHSANVLITFRTGSADVTDEAREALDTIGRALASEQLSGLRFEIDGHADPRGGADYNLRLSQARAESVVEYLVRNHQVSRDRLTAVGKGYSELLNTANPIAEENRRVTVRTRLE